MSVITLHVLFTNETHTVAKKRKFLAAQNIFVVSDIEFTEYSDIDALKTFPEINELYQKFDGFQSYTFEAIRFIETQKKVYPFFDGTISNKTNDEILLNMFPDVKAISRPTESYVGEIQVLLWPSINVKSLDQTEETFYFSSIKEAEEALKSILEGMNNV